MFIKILPTGYARWSVYNIRSCEIRDYISDPIKSPTTIGTARSFPPSLVATATCVGGVHTSPSLVQRVDVAALRT